MWPFDQPPNCATFTTRHVMTHHRPITRVVHDAADHGWQFLSDEGASMEDALLVCLNDIVAYDHTVLEIADLPPGWIATRDRVGSPWTRATQYANAAQIMVDWSKIGSISEFYEVVFRQCESPDWHGRNLNAIADSWIAGGINAVGPPYVFIFSSLKRTAPDLLQFRDAVLGIAQESIDVNGGLLETLD
ncbi:MAG: hypothetical protein SFV81_28635 [Pirellulaceae bacterium]|nr:hypothetical protein [Pirellulaceae bacterium]